MQIDLKNMDIQQIIEENTQLTQELQHARQQLARLQTGNTGMQTTGSAFADMPAGNRMQAQLSERFMHLLLENYPAIMLLFDRHGRLTYCTEVFLQMAGIARVDQIQGKNISEVFETFGDSKWVSRLHQEFQDAMRQGKCITLEETIAFGRRNARIYLISYTPMLNEHRKGEGAIALFHDITDAVQARGRAELMQEQAELARELAEAARERAERASTAKSDFLANMSHEMRTPMNAIIGMTSIAKSADDIEKKEYCLDKIEEASKHLLGVINDILDMSKIEANKFELNIEEFDFERMLMKVTSVIDFRVDEKHQDFFVQLDETIPTRIITDEQRLSQVLANLLSNAIKFTPENGRITLTTKRIKEENGIVTLQMGVKDTGIGISKSQQDKLFRSFEQADGGISRKFGGTGLGLAISKKIVEMMNGELWVESDLDKGSNFMFTIQARCGANNEQRKPSAIEWNTLRVLVVDDSPEVLSYFQSIAYTNGFHCDVIPSSFQACNLVQYHMERPYDVVFIDWTMPGMDGIQLARRIQQSCGGHSIVIMISAAEWNRVEPEARAAGVQRFVSKPLFPSLIVDCINECLSTHQETERSEDFSTDYVGRFQGKQILLAEDIAINREIVTELLSMTGVKIDCAENGRIAFEKVCDAPEKYDMVFMDIHMPEMDGYHATRSIRALPLPEAKTLPIIAMTANVFREDIDKCIAAGMNDHVGKPLDMEEVLSIMEKHM